jgi:hypothetical protein
MNNAGQIRAPSSEPITVEDAHAHFFPLALVREARKNLFELLGRLADQTPWNKRSWFRVTEIAERCARVEALVPLDQQKRDRALELLFAAILRGELDRVAHLCESPLTRIRFDPKSMSDPALFRPKAGDLWISRADCEGWFANNKIPFPKEWKVEISPAQRGPRGRPEEFNWREMEIRLEQDVKENGYLSDEQALHQNVKGHAKRLHLRRKAPSDRHVADIIKKRRWVQRFVAGNK